MGLIIAVRVYNDRVSIRTFQILRSGNRSLELHASTLDEMTRQLPEGYYTTFTTVSKGGKVAGLRAHLQRLYVPAAATGRHPAVDSATLRIRLAALVKENLPAESRVRLVLAKETAEIFLGIQPFEPLPDSVYFKGVDVISTELARTAPRIKDTAFIADSQIQRAELGRDVFEVLLTKNGLILEGMTSNFYGIRRKSLVTARRGVLLGVTRRAILRLARAQGLSIYYRAVRLDERLDEAFLTSSSRGVVPIVSVDKKPVGQGSVGKWSKTLLKAYEADVRARSEDIV